jgi:hypothetical protein
MSNHDEIIAIEEKNILSYINSFGILLCNNNKYLPSIFDVGGSWNAVVNLIEKKEIYYCKVFRKRTAYLSKDLYRMLKPFKQDITILPEKSLMIYNFLNKYGISNTKTMREILGLSTATFNLYFSPLLREMLVTAIDRDKTMNVSWSSFNWGIYSEWEEDNDYSYTYDKDLLYEILRRQLSQKEIDKLLAKNEYDDF